MKDLGDRMKEYEASSKQRLPNYLPIIIRVDGRAFHSWTEGLEEPFSNALRIVMTKTATRLCEEFHGAKLAYTQSDEINLLLTNHDSYATQPMFDNDVLKLSSVAASEATATFNRLWDAKPSGQDPRLPATFDGRAFVLSNHEEVVNYFIWRQKDWERNSLNMLARHHYSAKRLEGLSASERHDLLHEKGVNWNHVQAWHKRGVFVRPRLVKRVGTNPKTGEDVEADSVEWRPDYDPPILTSQRDYIHECLPVSLDPGKQNNTPPLLRRAT